MGSSASIMPASATTWHPDRLTAKQLRRHYPEFAGELEEMKMQSLTAKISFKISDKEIVEENLENGGSETGAQIRRALFQWRRLGEELRSEERRPESAIVKLTDVTEVPQMELLMLKSWVMRHIVKMMMGGKGGKWLWDLIPRFILAERAVRLAAQEMPRLNVLLTPLYFSRVRLGDFPTLSRWAKEGIRSIPGTWTLQAMSEVKKPLISASGPTGMFKDNDVSENVAKALLKGLARFHGAAWGHGRDSPLVSWITDRNPNASTLTLYYPNKFGLFPDGHELPDLGAPMSKRGDWRFCNINVKKFVSKLEMGMREICEPFIDTLRDMQRSYKIAIKEIGHVTDGKDGDRQLAARYGRSQTILHGDAHAWNMFWNLNATNERDRVKFIDLTNVGHGRCVWEVHYFLVQSMNCTCWLQLHRILRYYYQSLVSSCSGVGAARNGVKWQQSPREHDRSKPASMCDRDHLLQTMPYAAFLREYYLLAIVSAVHFFMGYYRAGRFSGSGARKLRAEMNEQTTKGARKRREHAYALLHAKKHLWLGTLPFIANLVTSSNALD